MLDGGTGADTMRGGTGDDIYVVDDVTVTVASPGIDLVEEVDGEGTDQVNAKASYELTEYVENLTLLGTSSINGTGNDLGNLIVGNNGNNTLDGAVRA